MAKLERKALVHYLDSEFKSVVSTASWFKLGIDIEEMNVELNSDTSTIKNIWNQSRVTDNGWAPSISAAPFYANPEDSIYVPIRDIALELKVGDSCRTLLLEVLIEDTADANHLAYVQEVFVKPTSYGGGTSGVNFPFTITFDGDRKTGYVTAASVTAGSPVFEEGEIPSGL